MHYSTQTNTAAENDSRANTLRNQHYHRPKSNMQKNNSKTLALAAAVAVGVGVGASAGTVTMQFTWTGTDYQAGFSVASPFTISEADAIGIYAFNVSDGGGTGISNPFYSVCLSPAGLLDGNSHTYNLIPFSQANPGIYPSQWAWNGDSSNPQYWGVQNAAYLWNKYGMSIVNSGASQTTKNQQAAALEFAIWTSLYNSSGYGVLAGSTFATPTSTMVQEGSFTAYQGYITDVASAGAFISSHLYTGNVLEGQEAVSGGAASGQSQEFFMLSNVPEPTTTAASALLLLPFGVTALRVLRRTPKGRAH